MIINLVIYSFLPCRALLALPPPLKPKDGLFPAEGWTRKLDDVKSRSAREEELCGRKVAVQN